MLVHPLIASTGCNHSLDACFMPPFSTRYPQQIQNWLADNLGRSVTVYEIEKLYKGVEKIVSSKHMHRRNRQRGKEGSAKAEESAKKKKVFERLKRQQSVAYKRLAKKIAILE